MSLGRFPSWLRTFTTSCQHYTKGACLPKVTYQRCSYARVSPLLFSSLFTLLSQQDTITSWYSPPKTLSYLELRAANRKRSSACVSARPKDDMEIAMYPRFDLRPQRLGLYTDTGFSYFPLNIKCDFSRPWRRLGMTQPNEPHLANEFEYLLPASYSRA